MKDHISILIFIISILKSDFQLCNVLYEFDSFKPEIFYLNSGNEYLNLIFFI
jgi:hypothetical protein